MKTHLSCLEILEARIAPAVFLVTTTADTEDLVNHNTGSLRDALALADAHPGADTIKFNILPAPVAPETNIIKLNGTELTSGGNVTIKGPGAGKLIIDGDGKSRIFDFNDNASSADSPVSISGISIMHGHATGHLGIGDKAQKDYGGGIYSAESLTLKNVVISGNSADGDGGGLEVSGNGTDTQLSISNCLVTGNTADSVSGGVGAFILKSLIISKTTVTGNTVTSNDSGGGIYAEVTNGGTGDLTITGCVISGNTAGYAGGLFVNNEGAGKTTISGTKITGNISTDTSGSSGGGGVYVDYGNTVITGCTISNNTAVYNGGGIFSAHHADSHPFSLTISKSTISGNQTLKTNAASQGGGGVFIRGNAEATPQKVKITSSQINNNGTALDGGGVFAENGIALTVSNSTFSGNHATGIGGGIATRGNDDALNSIFNKVNLTVNGGEFSGNTASAGGGISAEGDGAATTGDGAFSMTGSKVTGNTAQAVGGGIEITTNGAVTVKNAVFAGNVGVNYGGGLSISVSKNVVVSGGSVTGNFSHRGGGMWVYQSEGSISGVTISGNAAKSDGGGVNAGNSNVTLQVAKVTGNTAVSNPNFGGITDSGAKAHAPAAGHTGIVVTTIADSGGGSLREALALADDEITHPGVDTISFALPIADFVVNGAWTIKLGGTQLSSLGNVKIVGPGAGKLILDGNQQSRIFSFEELSADRPVTISGLSVVNGKDTGFGGGIASLQSLTLKNVVVSGNSSTEAGGVSAGGQGRKVSISNSFITGNTVSSFAGGLSLQTQSVIMKNTIVTGNIGGDNAGGVLVSVSGYNGVASSAAISDCLIAGNTAGYGGGLYLQNDSEPASTITLSNTNITGNVATATSGSQQGGGGIYADFASHTSLIGCTISNNEAAGGGGGGIKVKNFNSLTISKSTISGNRTKDLSGASGGGLFLQGDTANPLESVNISKSVIADNRSDGDGGGLVAKDGIKLTISTSTISGNRALNRGGGLVVFDSALTVTGGAISDNTAKYGGGIRASSIEPVTISSAKITGNIASKSGGGMYLGSSTGAVTLQKNIVSGNFASTGGGLFLLNNSGFAISGGSFTGNSALQGGAMNFDGSAGKILDVLITGNAANKGGGIFNNGTTLGAITLQIAKVIANTAVTNPNLGDTPGDLTTFNV